MVNKVSSLTYVPTADNSQYVATVKVDSAVSTDWSISLQGSVDGGNPIAPNWATVDNYTNPTAVELTYANFVFAVGAYQRQTFKIPPGTATLELLIPAG